MVGFLGLLPVLVLGALVWGVVTFVRRQSSEPFTLATAVAVYAQLLIIVGAVMALSGVATAVKAGLGYAELGYSYQSYLPPLPPPSFPSVQQPQPLQDEQQRNRHNRDADLLQGLTLGLIGMLVVGAHLGIARGTRHLRGGAPAWLTRGTVVVLSVLCALVGVIAGAMSLYRWLSYVLLQPVSNQPREQFGEVVGLAVAFLPVWVVTLLWLLRAAHRRLDLHGRAVQRD